MLKNGVRKEGLCKEDVCKDGGLIDWKSWWGYIRTIGRLRKLMRVCKDCDLVDWEDCWVYKDGDLVDWGVDGGM